MSDTESEPEDREPVRVARPSLPPLERYGAALERIWERGILSNDGPCVREFEEAFAAYSRLPFRPLAASSCDVALTLAVAALELPHGSRVLVPSLGFPSTVHALEWNGLKPHFVDVDEHDWCLHADQVEDQLKDVSMILATHMFGTPCDVAGLEALAARHGVALIFDAAQAAATWVHGRHVTSFGDASVISFSGAKIVTAGEGGIAVIAGGPQAARFERLRRYGMDSQGVSERTGLNAKLSELHGALGVLTLESLEEQVALRERIVAAYRHALGGREDIRLQHVPTGTRPTPTFFVIDLGDARDHVRKALAARQIESRPYFPALHLMPRFADLSRGELPVSEQLNEGLLALPLYSELEPAVVEEVCATVCETLDLVHSVEGK
ncbi:MAG: DegT/DnrJ/EryC1/StrS family aminotransferase [Solirubrobacteraceae bacterium]